MFSVESNGTGHTVTPPSGQVDIWKPKDISQVEITSGILDDSIPEEVVSTFKVYCPSHLLNKAELQRRFFEDFLSLMGRAS